MFFWIIVTCHAEWSECSIDPQPDFAACMNQAVQINENTDAIAVCTAKKAGDFIRAPESWAIPEAPDAQ